MGIFSDSSDMPWFAFEPETFGFPGAYPVERWSAAQLQYARAEMLVSGTALDKRDERQDLPLYPEKVNLWDFVCEVHATMLCGESGKTPQTLFTTSSGQRARTRAAKYTALLDSIVNKSDPALFWTIFYNANAYGGYGMIVRYNPGGEFPIIYEGVHPMSLYPVFDSQYRVIECFIHRIITHSEARWVYGIEIPDNEIPHYVEYWNPDEYQVKISQRVAKYKDGTQMQGDNPFKVAPVVYIPHLRKRSEWGVSQILGVGPLGLDFNARLADVSDAVRDMAQAQYWGFNVNQPREMRLGRTVIWNVGDGYDPRAVPTITALQAPANVKDGKTAAEWLWNLVLHLSHIPGVALGMDEGSQRSGETLRARFWSLVAHCMVERLFADSGLNQLAGIAVAGAQAIGLVSDGGLDDLRREQVWPDMLPQERLELVNEMVTRRSAGLIGQRSAIEKFGDVRDVEQEMSDIQAEKQAAAAQAAAQSQPKETQNDRKTRTDQ